MDNETRTYLPGEVRVVRNIETKVLPEGRVQSASSKVVGWLHGSHKHLRDALDYQSILAFPTKLLQGCMQGLAATYVHVESNGCFGNSGNFVQSFLQRLWMMPQHSSPFGVCNQSLGDQIIGQQHVFLYQSIRVANGIGLR